MKEQMPPRTKRKVKSLELKKIAELLLKISQIVI